LDELEYTGLGLDAAGTIDAVGTGVLLDVGTSVIVFHSPYCGPPRPRPSTW
jgi:Zn-dependent alcohol dehydrogenase